MFEIRPLANAGAQIIGLDLAGEIEPKVADGLRKAWLKFGVLLFRVEGAGAAEHLRLSRVFGELEEHPIVSSRIMGSPELIRVPDEKIPCYVINGELLNGFIPWHQDTCYTPAIAKGAILRMVTPASAGGATAWVDTAAAYDELPDPLKADIAGLEVEMAFHFDLYKVRFGMDGYTFRRARADEAPQFDHLSNEFAPVVHPLVVTHPESGRKSLQISPANLERVVGMDTNAGDALLREVVAHALQDRFIYKHDWQTGDMILWDNRRTCHMAFGFRPGVKRDAVRTTLAGSFRSGRYALSTDAD